MLAKLTAVPSLALVERLIPSTIWEGFRDTDGGREEGRAAECTDEDQYQCRHMHCISILALALANHNF